MHMSSKLHCESSVTQLQLGLPVVKQDWSQVSHSIRHAQNPIYLKWDGMQVSHSIRKHRNAYASKTAQDSHSNRPAQKRNKLKNFVFKSRPLSGTHGKLTCRASLTATFALYSAHTKRSCPAWLTTTLVLYSACIKMHMSRKIASSLALNLTRTETHMSSKIASSSHSILHAQKTHMLGC